MAGFLSPLTVTEISDSIFEVVDHAFQYKSNLLPDVIVVPVGFHTDFASVPRFLPLVYAALGDTAHEPAVIHDWLYYSAITDRATADRILLEAMKLMGMSAFRRWPIYWGVRIGGWHAWEVHRILGDPINGKFKDSPNIMGKP